MNVGKSLLIQLSKVTAPKQKKKAPPMLARLQTLLTAANNALEGTEDESLRSALVATSLTLLVKEAQSVIGELERGS
jgi:hypothetical protein